MPGTFPMFVLTQIGLSRPRDAGWAYLQRQLGGSPLSQQMPTSTPDNTTT